MLFRDDLSRHALFYRGQREYHAGMTAFACDGLASAEPVLIAIPGHMHYLVSEQPGEAGRYHGAVAHAAPPRPACAHSYRGG
jgi:hypothetical protein